MSKKSYVISGLIILGIIYSMAIGPGGRSGGAIQAEIGRIKVLTDDWPICSDAPFKIANEPTVDGNMQWNRTYGGAELDCANVMIQTADSGFALAGSTWNNTYGGNNPHYDVLLVKTDAHGTMEWQQTYGDANWELADVMIQTADGGFALAGYTDTNGTGERDAWLVKTDAHGEIEWQQTYGGLDGDWFCSIIQRVDGGFALAGDTRSFGAGGRDGWLVKTDAYGEIEWQQTYGGVGDETVLAGIQTVDGGYALTGYTKGGYTWNLWLVKTNSRGESQWMRTYDDSDLEFALAVIQTTDGGFALAGYTYSYGGSTYARLVKTDAQGEVEWQQTYGGAGDETVLAGIQTVDGGFALAGAWSFGAGGRDGWLVKTDAHGEIEWQQTYGDLENDEFCSIIQTVDGGFALAGDTQSFGAGDQDFWLVKTFPPEPTPPALSAPTQSEVGRIVVLADDWPISDRYWSTNVRMFTLNTFSWLTEFSLGKRILKDSQSGTSSRTSPTHDNMVDTLQTNGYTVTIMDTTSWTPALLETYDAVFIEIGPIDNILLTEYVKGGGSVFLVGGHSGSDQYNEFLLNFGMNLLEPVYLGHVTLMSFVPHPVTTGVSSLETGDPTPIEVHTSDPLVLSTFDGWNWLVVYSKIKASTTTTELVAHYQFENNVRDSAGSNHGTKHGATFVDGKLGTALHFDGVDDYVEVPDSGELSLTPPFTLEVWVHPEDVVSESSQQILWKIGTIGRNDDNYGLRWTSHPNCGGGTSSAFFFRIERASDDEDFDLFSNCHPINRWYHVVGIYDGTTVKIYVNGVLEGENYVGSFFPYTGSAPLQIGRDKLSNHTPESRNFKGTIDEVRIYTRALSKEEVEQHYQNEVATIRAPNVTVVSPNGGEYWRGTQTITWTAIDPQADPLTYTVYYSPNGGQTWTQLATGLTESSYLWDTTTVVDGTNYLIQVEASDGIYTGVDISNAPFEIANEAPNTAPTVRVIRPNGGERVRGTFEIQWSANDPDGDPLTFTINYSPNEGQTWTQLASGVTETSYVWDTSGVQVCTTYLIKVEASDGGFRAEDRSDAPFTVEREAPTETRSDAFFVPSFRVVEAFGALLVLLGLGKRQRRRKIFWEGQYDA